jgi:signal transduction histidine kinase
LLKCLIFDLENGRASHLGKNSLHDRKGFVRLSGERKLDASGEEDKVLRLPRPRSIRARYTLAAGLLSLIVLMVIGTGFALVIRNRIQAGIFEETQRAATQWIASGARAVPQFTRVELLQLVDSRGRVAAASRPAAGLPPLSTARPPAGDRLQDRTECGPRIGCVMLTAIRVSPAEAARFWHGDARIVLAGMREPPILDTGRLEAVIVGIVLPLAGLVTWLTWWVVGRTLRPVEAMREQTSKVTRGDLSARMPQPSGQDEIARLARSANTALARLQGEVQQQRRFASETSHELRNPIAGLRAELEEALLHPREVNPRDTIQAALSATDRLEAIVNDLLALARLRNGDLIPAEPVDLTELVAREASSRCHGVPVRARTACGVRVRGHPIQLMRVVDNLLDNAQRHAESAVEITVDRDGDEAVVVVTDDGAGIAPEDRERVFERFTRLAEGRYRDPGGSGLGLALARDIAHAHHGTLRIEDSPQGARFVLRLPLLSMEPGTPDERGAGHAAED